MKNKSIVDMLEQISSDLLNLNSVLINLKSMIGVLSLAELRSASQEEGYKSDAPLLKVLYRLSKLIIESFHKISDSLKDEKSSVDSLYEEMENCYDMICDLSNNLCSIKDRKLKYLSELIDTNEKTEYKGNDSVMDVPKVAHFLYDYLELEPFTNFMDTVKEFYYRIEYGVKGKRGVKV